MRNRRNPTPHRHRWAMILGIFVTMGAAHAQSPEELERNRRMLEEGPSEALVVDSLGPENPEREAIAGAPAIGPESYQVPIAELVREGSYLRDRRGRLIDVEGAWIFVFDPDEHGDSDPPMIMQPCIRSKEMERLVSGAVGPTPTFIVSGRVFAYRQRNFLLPERFFVVDYGAASLDRPERATEDAADANAPGSATAPDPRVEELLESMRAGTPVRPSTDLQESNRIDMDADRTLLREGTLVMNQIGRIVRGGAGYWTFVADEGVQSQSHPPMRLLPCMNLVGIERTLDEVGETVPFSLSGQVFAYEGLNYLLVTVYRLELDREGNTVAAH